MPPWRPAHAQSICSSVTSTVNQRTIKQINPVEAGHLIYYTAKLYGINWPQWKEHMMDSFDLCGLLLMVLGEVEEPDEEEEPNNYHAWKFNNTSLGKCSARPSKKLKWYTCLDPTLPQRCSKLCA
jgi:hypothetical protein